MTVALRRQFPAALPRPPPDFVDDLCAAAAGDQTGQLLKYLYRDYDAVLADDAYHVNDTETAIIRHAACALPDLVGKRGDVLELGCGTAAAVRAKTLPILDAIDARSYTANDLWPPHVTAAYETVREERPMIAAAGLTADFMGAACPRLAMPDRGLLILGATIGNLVACVANSAPVDVLTGTLGHLRRLIGPTGRMIVTYDTSSNGVELERIYNTPSHVAFRREITTLIASACSEPVGDDDFDVPTIWEADKRRLSHLLIPKRTIMVDLTDHPFTLDAGRPVLLGVSIKFTPEIFNEAAQQSGYRTARIFAQPENPAVLQVLMPA